MSTSAAISKQLRVACVDRLQTTEDVVEEVHRLLALPGADVNDGNQNGKAAIHHAAQLRADTDVLACLVAANADVNAATHRGHTPLIYAAGRCRENVVRFLLDHGADAATWTVLGDDCVSMGRKKGLSEDLLLELERNQQASQQRRDFRGDERAMLAQQEHTRHCSCCRQRQAAELTGVNGSSAVEAEVVDLAARLGGAATDSDEALSAALLDAAGLDVTTLRQTLEFCLSARATDDENGGQQHEEEDVKARAIRCEQLLRASRDEALGRCLGKGAKGRARRPVRMVAGAVFAAIQSDGVVAAMERQGLQLRNLIEATDAHIAAELVRLWPPEACDAQACLAVWDKLLVHGSNGWHSVMEAHGRPRRQGGPKVASWSRALRWASSVGFEGWRDAAGVLLDEAHTSGVLHHLLSSLGAVDEQQQQKQPRGAFRKELLSRKSPVDALPASLDELLTSRFGSYWAIPLTVQKCPPSGRAAPEVAAPAVSIDELPVMVLDHEPVFVNHSQAIVELHDRLRALAREEARRGAPPLRIGVDTEWADAVEDEDETVRPRAAVSSPPRLAVVQLAVRGCGTWVIDALSSDLQCAVGKLLLWALGSQTTDDAPVVVLGFAFQGDLGVLRPICGGELSACALIDLQLLARVAKEDTPSLRKVCARTLGKALDKTQQCSDWAQRPLSAAQVQYAALDAKVLLDIYDILSLADEVQRCAACAA